MQISIQEEALAYLRQKGVDALVIRVRGCST